MLGASLNDSAVVDELAHIPAGYAYLRFQDYRLNPEHPPLLKALAAVPLLFLGPQFPVNDPNWTTAVNAEFGVGGAFLFGVRNNADELIRWARFFPILLTIGLVLFTYYWAKRLFGEPWALLPATLLAFSPIVLAHGHYVTTDIAAAFGAMLGLFTFIRYLERPSWLNLLFAGLGFGAAEVMKFSTILLIPVYILLTIIFFAAAYRKNGRVGAFRSGWHFLWGPALIFIIGLVIVIYPLYAIFTANYPQARQMSDTRAIIGYLVLPTAPHNLSHYLATIDIWGAGRALTRPLSEYLLGVIMVLERISGSDISYFLGKVYAHGTTFYFPVVYSLKETLPVLLLIGLGSTGAIVRMIQSIARREWKLRRYILENFPLFAMLVFVALYWIWSMASPLNIGVRHIIPTIPLIYLLLTSSVKKWFEELSPGMSGVWNLRNLLLIILPLWLIAESALAYPNYLSYYNELGGGTRNGYRLAADSNYDWGQDMYALNDWLKAHPEVDKLALDLFGGSNPDYYLGDKYVGWSSELGSPASRGIHWFAVSITILQNAIQPATYNRNPKDEYSWLTAIRQKEPGVGGVPTPDYRVGTSIFIYKL